MEEKLDLILNELKIIKDSQTEVKADLEGLKEKQQEMKYILDAVRENQDVSNAKNEALEGIQDRQDRIIAQLTYRYFDHDSDIKDLKREIHQIKVQS
ncbi:hypothetical protein ACFFIX_11040 [Metabacillus herbersteinensis]|uniref:Uncharacterized protein n=1 Tax=Metabacillus herbersteinensis TaxID=283816 RepID=A0ABV6GE76_9BACI